MLPNIGHPSHKERRNCLAHRVDLGVDCLPDQIWYGRLVLDILEVVLPDSHEILPAKVSTALKRCQYD